MNLAHRPDALRWQTPLVVIVCGCLVAGLTFGPRTTMGLLLPPMNRDTGWTRDILALAIAIQHIVWGITQPFGGAIADRLGVVRALCLGALFYSAGLMAMASAATPAVLYLGGALVGIGLAGASYNIVLAAYGKLLPPQTRAVATGIGGAAGSLGQFLFAPLCVLLLDVSDWRTTLLVFGALLLLVIPFSFPLTTAAQIREAEQASLSKESVTQVFWNALRHFSYLLLIAGYFVNGFHLAFINFHLPAHLQDGGLDRPSAGWVIATIGLFNIAGSVAVGWLCRQFPNRHVLAGIYALRAVSIAVFLVLPLSPSVAFTFAAIMGVLWVSSVTAVSGLLTTMFGTAFLGSLYGLAYFFHQVGAFAGVWLGGLAFEQTGSYDVVWWSLVVASAVSAALALLIREAPRRGNGDPSR